MRKHKDALSRRSLHAVMGSKYVPENAQGGISFIPGARYNRQGLLIKGPVHEKSKPGLLVRVIKWAGFARVLKAGGNG